MKIMLSIFLCIFVTLFGHFYFAVSFSFEIIFFVFVGVCLYDSLGIMVTLFLRDEMPLLTANLLPFLIAMDLFKSGVWRSDNCFCDLPTIWKLKLL